MASANEVCSTQAFHAAVALNGAYEVEFAVAKSGVAGCGPNGTAGDFGNLLLVAHEVDPHFDYTYAAYQPTVGTPQNAYTHVFSHNQNGTEHKRTDCAFVNGSNASSKFKVCTLHTTANGQAPEQITELKNSSNMGERTLFAGDFNTRDWIINNLNTWRWDTLHTGTATAGAGKIDWVLGRSDGSFTRVSNSYIGGTGNGGGVSDHYELNAFLRAN